MGVTGDIELMAALRALGAGVPPADIDKAAIASLQPMLTETIDGYKAHRQLRRTDARIHLDQGIVVKRTAGNASRRSYKLGATGKRAIAIAHLVELGTAPHWQPKRKWMHPGAKRFPVMTQAFEANKEDVETIFATQLWQRLQARVFDIAKKGRRTK